MPHILMQVSDSVNVRQQQDTTAASPAFNRQVDADSSTFPNDTVTVEGSVSPGTGQDTSQVQQVQTVSVPLMVTRRPATPQAIEEIAMDTPYIADLRWNAGNHFLETNPLSGLSSQPHHEVLQGITLQEPGSARELNPVEKIRDQEDWLTGLLFFIVLLFIWIRLFYGKFYAQLAESVMNFQISSKLYDEKNVLTRRVSMILDITYFMILAIFLYELNAHFEIVNTASGNISFYLILLGCVVLYSLVRIIVLQITGFVFYSGSLFSEYIHHTYVFNKGMGIVLFPVILTAVYVPPVLATYILLVGIGVYGIFFILKTIRAFKIIFWKDVFLFYMILYLCTLEILPLLLGYKLLKSLI